MSEQIYPPFPPNPDRRAAGFNREIERLKRRTAMPTLAGAGFDFALLEGTGTIPAGPTANRYVFGLGGANSDTPADWTSSTTSFELSSHTFSGAIVNAGAHQGVSILVTGTYFMFMQMQITTSATTYRGVDLSLSLEKTTDSVNGVDYDFIFGDPLLTVDGYSYNAVVMSVPPTIGGVTGPPSGPICLQAKNNTAGSYTVDVGLLIIRSPFALPEF